MSYDGEKYVSIRPNSKCYVCKYTIVDMGVWLKFSGWNHQLSRGTFAELQYHIRKLSRQSKICNWLLSADFLLLINCLHNCKTTYKTQILQLHNTVTT